MNCRLILIFILIGGFGCKPKENNSLYRIALWKNNCNAAISFTFDDNSPGQISTALPLFDQYNFKATFFTMFKSSPNWNGLRRAISNGHEVGSHSMTHTSFAELSVEEQGFEQLTSRDIINDSLGAKTCLSFAYPFCDPGNKKTTQRYFISARGCNGQIESSLPNDLMNVSSIVCGTEGPINSSVQFEKIAKESSSEMGWLVYLLHGIDNDGGWSPLKSEVLNAHLEYLNRNRQVYWVDSYINIVKYIREREETNILELSKSSDDITLELRNNLDSKIYDQPLTVLRMLPDHWYNAVASQNDKLVSTSIVSNGLNRYIQFDAIPNQKIIRLTKLDTVSFQNN